jgi:hypothetical protein
MENLVEPLFVHGHALSLQHDSHAPIADAAALLGDFVHILTDFRFAGWPLSPHLLRIDTDQDAGPMLRDRTIPQRPQRRVPPLPRRLQDFPDRSFSARLSSIAIRQQAIGIGQLHPSILGLQLLERVRGQPLLPAKLRGRRPSLLLFDHPDNLRLGETAFPHVVCSSRLGRLSITAKERPGGQVTGSHHHASFYETCRCVITRW